MTLSHSMLAIEISTPGGPDVLTPASVPVAVPGHRQIVIRIAYAVLLLVFTTVWMLDATTWFTEAGVLHLDAARKVAIDGTWSLFFWLPTDPRLVYAGLMILFAQGLLLLLGCWSRFQAACIFVWLTSFHNRNLLICDGEDTVFRLFAFFMIFMPLDHAWSLRRRLFGNEKGQGQARDRVGSSDSAWALRLMQIVLQIVIQMVKME